jgi:hypothetical protein
MFGLVRTFKNDKNCKTKCNPIDYEYWSWVQHLWGQFMGQTGFMQLQSVLIL